ELAGVDPAALGERGGHGERGVAAERADLEYALRPPEPDQELEEPAGDRAAEHLLGAEAACRLLRQLSEQRVVGGGKPFDVVRELRREDLRHHARRTSRR